MKNFIFKSTGADLQKMFQLFETKLDVCSANILYITHQIDFVRKKLIELVNDKSLQKQVDEYFEDNAEDKAEHIPDIIQDK